MHASLRHLLSCRRGAVSVEYALLVALIILVLIGVLNEIGASNVGIMTSVRDSLDAQNPS